MNRSERPTTAADRVASHLPPALAELAELEGVQAAFADALGVEHRASPEAVVALLRALGVDLRGDADAAQALAGRRRERAARTVPPVVVAWAGEGCEVELTLPPGSAGGAVDCRLELEGGRARVLRRSLDRLEAGAPKVAGGETFPTRRLPLPGPLPLGIHRLRLELAGEAHEARVISAPRRAWEGTPDERRWGVFLPLYSLHGRESLGIGDYSDLAALAAWTAGQGGGAVATLPLLAAFLDEPCEPSPYAPASRLFWNELYVDPRALPEWEAAPAARALLESPGFRAELERLGAAPEVDYRRLAALRRRLLAPLAEAFFAAPGGARHDAFAAYRASRPRLGDYAAFRAAGERFGGPWQTWPEPARGGELRADDPDEAARRYHLYAQFSASEQLARVAEALPDGLYLDLPLGVHPSSFDAWRERAQFLSGVSAGAPPDPLFTGGQDWGFQPLHPERMRAGGYGYFAAAITHHLEHAGLLRIDHAMQLHRLYCIPRGFGATEGLYLAYPADELYAVLTLASHRGRARLVGENLGTVPDAVDAALAEHGILKMFVLQFELGTCHRPVPDDVVASLNTHDTPTLAAFLAADDVADQVALGLATEAAAAEQAAGRARLAAGLAQRLREAGRLTEENPEAVAAAMLEELGESAAPLVLVNLEDLWGERAPQNVPGTCDERPNWRRRARPGLAEIEADPQVASGLARLDNARRRSRAVAEARHARPEVHTVPAPPAAWSRLTADDLHLFNEGRHLRLWEKLGAHPAVVEGAAGTVFAVWAPDAAAVSVVGDFNGWEAGVHRMQVRGGSGIWEGFVAGAGHGQRYKYEVVSRYGGHRAFKTDPYATFAETPPATASILWDLDYAWGDGEWMAARARGQGVTGAGGTGAPVSIYEVHLGSWRRYADGRPLSYRETAPELARHVRALGFTHVELLPVMEHPFYGSWGYQTTGYFAPTSRYGTPQDFMAFVDHLHREGIGVILDWVPSHFPNDPHGLAFFDGTHVYEHADPRLGFHPDWGSCIFNYARNEVRGFLISSAMFWLETFHADGLRLDAVASMLYRDYSRKPGEWIPNAHGGRENLEAVELLRQLNAAVYERLPGVQTFAEESTSWPGVSRPTYVGGLGFGYKWDMGWMHDTLAYFANDPLFRKFHHHQLTFRMMYAWSESFCLPLSHDEVVHGKGSLLAKMPGDDWQKRANLRLLLGFQWCQPGKKLLFMGCEFGQWREWAHEEEIDWALAAEPAHAGLQRWVADLNRAYRSLPALHQLDCDAEGFYWLVANDADLSVAAFLRRPREGGAPAVCAFNFTPMPRHGYRLGVPSAGRWREVVNGDAPEYGGSGQGNYGGVEAVPEALHGQSHSVEVTLPPLAALILTLDSGPPATGEPAA